MPVPSLTELFVPGSRPDRFEKALATSADHVIIDLEDAVAPEDKSTALASIVTAVERGLSRPIRVRVNDVAARAGELDVLADLSSRHPGALEGIVLPKTESGEEIRDVARRFAAEVEVVALIETALGVHRSDEIAATAGLGRFAVGALDLALDVDGAADSALIDAVYARLVIASRVHSLPAPLGSPSTEIDDTDAVRRDTARLRGIGIGGRLCIHPAQLEPVRSAFLPSDAEVAWARAVEASTGAAVRVAGQMVDKPVRDRAARILARAGVSA